MDLKYKILIVTVVLVGTFALGRYTVPEKIKIETKVVEVVKEVKVTDTKQDAHKHTVITEVSLPSGEKKKTTEIVYDSSKERDSHTVIDDTKKESSTETVVKGDSKVSISLLGGLKLDNRTPVYGASISKPVLGPLTIGIWGLSDSSCGASIGVTF